MNLQADSKCCFRQKVDLSKYCTMQVGPKAEFFVEPTTEEALRDVLKTISEQRLPYIILGKGANVIFSGSHYPGCVISLLRFQPHQFSASKETGLVSTSAGLHLFRFTTLCKEAGLSGAEFLVSIPGTVGGALIMNAGFSRHAGQVNQIGDITFSVRVMDQEGNMRTIPKKEIQFEYRKTNLSRFLIVGAVFQLWKRPKEEIEKEMARCFEYRNTHQDIRYPSSGSIFKNPSESIQSAGQLIENSKLKGFRVGDAAVSEKHANYIVNLGSATSEEVLELIEIIKKKVFDESGILLETEVKIIRIP